MHSAYLILSYNNYVDVYTKSLRMFRLGGVIATIDWSFLHSAPSCLDSAM